MELILEFAIFKLLEILLFIMKLVKKKIEFLIRIARIIKRPLAPTEITIIFSKISDIPIFRLFENIPYILILMEKFLLNGRFR